MPVHGQCVLRAVQLVGYQGPCLVLTGGAVRYTSSGDDALLSMPVLTMAMLGTLRSSRSAEVTDYQQSCSARLTADGAALKSLLAF